MDIKKLYCLQGKEPLELQKHYFYKVLSPWSFKKLYFLKGLEPLELQTALFLQGLEPLELPQALLLLGLEPLENKKLYFCKVWSLWKSKSFIFLSLRKKHILKENAEGPSARKTIFLKEELKRQNTQATCLREIL